VGPGAGRSRAPSGMTRKGKDDPPNFVIPESPRERTAPGPTKRRAIADHKGRLPWPQAAFSPGMVKPNASSSAPSLAIVAASSSTSGGRRRFHCMSPE